MVWWKRGKRWHGVGSGVRWCGGKRYKVVRGGVELCGVAMEFCRVDDNIGVVENRLCTVFFYSFCVINSRSKKASNCSCFNCYYTGSKGMYYLCTSSTPCVLLWHFKFISNIWSVHLGKWKSNQSSSRHPLSLGHHVTTVVILTALWFQSWHSAMLNYIAVAFVWCRFCRCLSKGLIFLC